MAEEKEEEGAAAPAAESAAGAETEGGDTAESDKQSKLLLVVLAVNLVVLLLALGTVIYTRIIFERPAIMEDDEIHKKRKEAKAPPPSAERVLVPLEDLHINLASSSTSTHMVSVTMTIECANEAGSKLFKAHTTELTDRMINTFNKKQFSELNTNQGRLMLKEQIIREFNEMLGTHAVTDIYYVNFLLQ